MDLSNVLAQLLPANPEYVPNPRKWKFWRDSFIIFWAFSFIGHMVEFLCTRLGLDFFGNPPAYQPFFQLAIPYGFGAVAILWFVYPLVASRKIRVTMTFVLSALLCTAVEFLCAWVVYLHFGFNAYWDYSDAFMNLFGFVCLRNSLAFGVGGVVVIYILFPWIDFFLKKASRAGLNILFWVLFVGYMVVHACGLVATGSVFG
jgi:uncharacterized membrane protein